MKLTKHSNGASAYGRAKVYAVWILETCASSNWTYRYLLRGSSAYALYSKQTAQDCSEVAFREKSAKPAEIKKHYLVLSNIFQKVILRRRVELVHVFIIPHTCICMNKNFHQSIAASWRSDQLLKETTNVLQTQFGHVGKLGTCRRLFCCFSSDVTLGILNIFLANGRYVSQNYVTRTRRGRYCQIWLHTRAGRAEASKYTVGVHACDGSPYVWVDVPGSLTGCPMETRADYQGVPG